MYNSFTMTMHIFLVLPFLLQMSHGRPQQQTQLVTQMLPPNQAATLGPGALGPMQSPAASLGQILVNLLNYKLQWLNQLAGHFTGIGPTQGPSFKPGLLGALGALGASQVPVIPGPPHLGQPHHGYPFMTTLVTTLSGNAPTVPGITISGAPVNHLATPGLYPGAPTTSPPQDFHWVPPYAPEPPQVAQPPVAIAAPQGQAAAQPPPTQPAAALPAARPQPLAQPPLPAQQAIIPVIPAIDDVPLQTPTRPVISPPAVAVPAPAAAAVAAPLAAVAAPVAAVVAPAAAAVAAPLAAVPAPAAAVPVNNLVETRF